MSQATDQLSRAIERAALMIATWDAGEAEIWLARAEDALALCTAELRDVQLTLKEAKERQNRPRRVRPDPKL